MIGSLRGTLVRSLSSGELLIEVGGVGYRVLVPASVAQHLDSGSEVFLHVHTHVREDAIVLYGFLSDDERRCFETLIGISGIGPSIALSMLSSISPVALAEAIADGDTTALCAVPGIGKKTAARLLLELKGKLQSSQTAGQVSAGADAGARSLARDALVELGYTSAEITPALAGLDVDLGVDELLRHALKSLATR